ncbi:related to trichodiene oxygenase cytochrome P450 [Phialocephala subalpina]|uniref:Related to trichodiene oxygenase cytochrome P450 n=1 Tax=Phialocephala subalpina TaxID=576137 RepID=A0A1L7XDL2_9HELO|nr:related to trichodiene oxygenase cytochrome P450 [Phialocephala subalpina]
MVSNAPIVFLVPPYLSFLLFVLETSLIMKCAVFIATLLLVALGVALYRLYFSPLSHIPGPKLAAITQLYEIYYDIYLGGQFMLHFKSLHEKYGTHPQAAGELPKLRLLGPIIRINPWEVHINNPEFYDTIYTSTSYFDKVPEHVDWSDVSGSGQATASHLLHTSRRKTLNRFFSKRRITAFAPEIQVRAEKLCNRFLSEYRNTSKTLKLDFAFGCFATDIVTEYAFSKEYRYLDYPNFFAPFLETVKKAGLVMHVFQIFPIVRKVKDIKIQVDDIITGRNEGHKDASHPSIFHDILDSDLPPSEKKARRLADEAVAVVGAGFETTKGAMTITSFHVLNNPKILQTLKQELTAAWPDINSPPSLQVLEQLPYLTAVIQEGLRLLYGIAFRLPRTSNSPIVYGSYVIPPGTPFSMCQYYMHQNETIFPSPNTFDPSRWLADPVTGVMPTAPNGKLLTRYLTSFSRGTRSCLGMHLAYAELYIGLANVFRRCDLELFETTTRDVEIHSEHFLPRAHPDSKGVRVLVI